MISPNFYIEENLASNRISFAKIKHFPKKSLSIAIGYTLHEVLEGQDLYSIARTYFGEYGERYWTTLADANGITKPDWLVVGQFIKIPKLVVEDKIDKKVTYENNVSTAIKI